MQKPQHPHFSAHICMQYLCHRIGITHEQLQNELEQFLGFSGDQVEFVPVGDKIQITTARYIMLMTPTGRIDNYRLRPGLRRAQIHIHTVPTPRERARQNKRQPVKSSRPRQPQDNQSHIVEQIKAETTTAPRVFVRRRRTMEPH